MVPSANRGLSCDASISENVTLGELYQLTKFHAFDTKCTSHPKNVINLLDYYTCHDILIKWKICLCIKYDNCKLVTSSNQTTPTKINNYCRTGKVRVCDYFANTRTTIALANLTHAINYIHGNTNHHWRWWRVGR